MCHGNNRTPRMDRNAPGGLLHHSIAQLSHERGPFRSLNRCASTRFPVRYTPLYSHTYPRARTYTAISGGSRRSGFTLVEMLVVIAILGILFGLLFIPVTNSFKFVGQERVEINEQNTTREMLREVTAQLSEAMQVQLLPNTQVVNNTRDRLNPGGVSPRHTGAQPGNPTRIDLLMPVTSLVNAPVPPDTGNPKQPGPVRVSLFLGVANPGAAYNNPIARKVGGGPVSGDDNEYVLWRAVYNLDDPNDPVRQFIDQFYGGDRQGALADPWFFDDSLQPVYQSPGTPVPPAQLANYKGSRELLYTGWPNRKNQFVPGMAKYTARVQMNGKWIPVGSELTPVVVLGTMDAVRATWINSGIGGGWIIDPKVLFTPAASGNEALTASNQGTTFQASSGLWTGGQSGAPPYRYNIYWGSSFNDVYDPSGVTLNPPAGVQIQALNGPANQPFLLDPRTGRISFTEFQATEMIPVTANQNVYHLQLPNSSNTSTIARVSGIGFVRPQVIPFSESVTLLNYQGGSVVGSIPFQRQVGSVVTTDPNADPRGATAYQTASGTLPLGAGTYAINYTSNPEVSSAPFPAAPPAQNLASLEQPLVEVPPSNVDSNVQPYSGGSGAMLQVSYRFTFSTLDALGNPVAHAMATYSSQRFVHLTVGLRAFDASSSQAHDYSLATSVASANPADEQTGVE